MKAAVYTIFLCTLYLKAICPYLMEPIAKIVYTFAEGMFYSIYLVLVLKIELIDTYSN